MNSIIEIHDSTLASISFVGHDLVLCLSPAYVHQTAGRPGIDQGSGWVQDINVVFSEAVVEFSPLEIPCGLSERTLSVGEIHWDNGIPLPLAVSGEVSLTAITCQNERLVVRGTGASAVTLGALRYVEEFPGSAND